MHKVTIMESSERNLCCGCLCAGRKMRLLDEFWNKRCFIQIIDDSSLVEKTKDSDVWLCWECHALVGRFTSFRRQVQKACGTLQDYTRQEPHLLPSLSHLDTHKTLSLSILPDEPDADYSFQIVTVNTIKKEEPVPIKEETEDNVSVYSDRSDDIFLIDMCRKTKRAKVVENGVKKRRKKRAEKIEEEPQIYKELELSLAELHGERLARAARDEFRDAPFRCERCVAAFADRHARADHDAKHKPSNFTCDICECTFASEVSYNYHTNKHKRRYQCSVCVQLFVSKRAVTKHYETAHCVGTDLDYEFNNKTTVNGDTGGTVDLEDVDKPPAPTFPCEFCAKTFRWKTSLRKHLETHRIESGQKRKPYCEPCRLSFTTTSNLQKHVKTSSKHQIQLKLRKLKDSLPEESTTPESREAHVTQIKISVNSARQTFPCQQCDKRFQWRGNLLRHLHSHAARANGELVCEPCNRTFSSIATYKQHMKISRKHVSENDFKYMCSECGKRFANKTRLKDHVDWEHLKNYVHKCAACGKVFKSHTSLYLHRQVVHRRGVDHLCDHCGKPFPNRAKLRSHVTALHSGACPFACAACGARFSWHSCLSRHVRRVHRGKQEA